TELKESVNSTLSKFETIIITRLTQATHGFQSYAAEYIEWIVPDLLAVTLQFDDPTDPFVMRSNLGATKRRYEWIYKQLTNALDVEVVKKGHWSSKWHINRLAFYAIYRPEPFMK